MKPNLFKIILVTLSLLSTYAWSSDNLTNIENQLLKIENTGKNVTIHESKMKETLRELGSIRARLSELLDTEGKLIDKTTRDLTSLGAPLKTEPVDVAKKRKELEANKKEHEKRRSTIRLLTLRADDVHKIYSDRLANSLKTRLMARTPDIVLLMGKGLAKSEHWLDGAKKVIQQPVGIKAVHTDKLVYIILVTAFVLIITIFVSLKTHTLVQNHKWGDFFSDHFACALSVTLTRWLPYLLTTTVFAIGFRLVSDQEQTSVSYYLLIVYGLPVFLGFLALIEFLMVPRPPSSLFLVEDKRLANSIASRLRLLLLILFIAIILFSSSMRSVLSDEMFFVARGAFAVVFAVILTSLSKTLGKLPSLDKIAWLRLISISAVYIALVSELIGYRNLSTMIFRVSLGVLISFSVLMFLRKLFSDIYDGLEAGDKDWQKTLRKVMGIRDGSPISWLPWMRFLTGLIFWTGFIYVLLRVVGLSETTLQQVYLVLRQGFEIGSLKVVPEKILWAIATFLLLYLFSSWFKVRIEKYLRTRIRMERGAREAMVTMLGYIGAALSIIVALGISGFTFTNLAIIAGALSVGIGFGLQNIVNNFVSGLILLFERPVKTGDWISVGSTEGYVKKIRIRSTQIQTFDRADVIIPNSDLISNQVTNWMLYDQKGRIRVPVGVAYGSDTQKVKDILLEVAEEHTDVIKNNDFYKIRVMFLAFGDSSLNFELRCFIRNIDNRIQVISDLNFSIDKKFRENGIEIPFPQHDVHIKEHKGLNSDGNKKDDT